MSSLAPFFLGIPSEDLANSFMLKKFAIPKAPPGIYRFTTHPLFLEQKGE
jgi:hypothetical protein